MISHPFRKRRGRDGATPELQSLVQEEDDWSCDALYWIKPIEGRGVPVSCGIRVERNPTPKQEEKEKKNAQVEDPYGRGQALQEDWYRQNRPSPDEDSAHPFVKVTQSEAQARQERCGFRR